MATGLNQNNEIRVQYNVVSDSHEQHIPPLRALAATQEALGQKPTKIFVSDNAPRDQSLAVDVFHGCREFQAELDGQTEHLRAPATPLQLSPLSALEDDQVSIVQNVRDIDGKCSSLLHLVEDNNSNTVYFTLNAEWDTERKTNATKDRKKVGKVALIQLSHKLLDGKVRSIIIQMRGKTKLPTMLLALFKCKKVVWAGSRVAADIVLIGKDFDCESEMADTKRRSINLGLMARKRGVVSDGKTSLQALTACLLSLHMDKGPVVRFTRWSKPTLSKEEIAYAANDVIIPFRILEELLPRPDLSLRLSAKDVDEIGKVVDIVPNSGPVKDLATRAGVGRIVAKSATFTSPVSGRTLNARKGTIMVQVDEVLAPAFVVPSLKEGMTHTLGECGDAPFVVPLPVRMLKNHVEDESIPVYSGGGNATKVLAAVAACDSAREARCKSMEEPNDDVVDLDLDDGKVVDGAADLFDPSREEEIQAAAMALDVSRRAIESSEKMEDVGRNEATKNLLSEPPSVIYDKFSSCLGDSFHVIQRPRVPMYHCAKKAFCYAFQEALLMWDPEVMAEAKNKLKATGMTDEEIDNLLYFRADIFRACVPRIRLPPSRLYWRIRAVFATFGVIVDPESNKPLFNKDAWAKANSILSEILEGYHSDPPGIDTYEFLMKEDGSHVMNSFGMRIIRSMLSTSPVENMHKHANQLHGGSVIGIKTGYFIQKDFNHRFSHAMAERHRAEFPILGHADTWVVNSLQDIVAENHGKSVFATLPNPSDFELSIMEKSGIVPLHSDELAERLNSMDFQSVELSEDLQFLADRLGTKLPFLPVVGKKSYKLFSELLLKQKGAFNENEMASVWLDYVDGKDIFPALPAHLRKYHDRHIKNRRTKHVLKQKKAALEAMRKVNRRTALIGDDGDETDSPFASTDIDGITHQTASAELFVPGDARECAGHVRVLATKPSLRKVRLPKREKRPPTPVPIAAAPQHADPPSWELPPKKKVRKGDRRTRKQRACKNCIVWDSGDRTQAEQCPGRHSNPKCVCPRGLPPINVA